MKANQELPIIQQTYDLIVWFLPILNRLPRDHHFLLGSRITNGLYDLLEQLIQARYTQKKLTKIEAIKSRLDVSRYQTRLLRDLSLMDARRYKHVSGLVNEIVKSLGGWIKQQKQVTT